MRQDDPESLADTRNRGAATEPGAPMLPPLSLYVHLPWCLRKCPYCDFNSHTAGQDPPKGRYLEALIADLGAEAPAAAGRPVESVFFGGGTPSLFDAAEIAALLEAVARGLSLAPDAEITMEANPGALEHGRLAAYRRAGVNRLSLGAQSFDAATLLRLGRIHGPAEILAAFDEALRGGFGNINLDLMYALPGQTVGMAVADIEQALRLSPAHVSWYQLTLEPNTVFHARPPTDLPNEDAVDAIETECRMRLAAAGYEQYETSAFARPGRRCRHNLNYWRFGDYLAVGAGAHGKLTGADGIRRYRKPAHPRAYMQAIEQAMENGAPAGERRLLAAADAAFEYMLNLLRLPEGFAEAGFRERTGLGFEVVAEPMARARAAGLIEPAGRGRWRPTERGRRYQNDLQALFLPEPPPGRFGRFIHKGGREPVISGY